MSENSLVQTILLFNRLSKYPPEQIYNVIKEETSQIVAVILSRLEPKISKTILGMFSTEDQQDIMYRMATVDNIPPEFLAEVANSIGEKLRYISTDSGASLDGQGKMAEILKHMPGDKSKAILEGLEKKDTNLADRVSRKIVTMDDLPNYELKGMQHALAKIDVSMIAMALKGVTAEAKTAVWDALSANRKKLLKEEIKLLSPQKRSDVTLAQTELLANMRNFLDQGILRSKSDASKDEWV